MAGHFRLKNIIIAKLAGWFPALAEKLVAGYQPVSNVGGVPWAQLNKPLDECKVAFVTTAGIHHGSQQPFDMQDADGDPTYRVLDSETLWDDFKITHDYYNHANAEKDPNIVLPLDRLKEFKSAGVIGELAKKHYGFMGHVDGEHITHLIEKSAREVADNLKSDQVDLVILAPA